MSDWVQAYTDGSCLGNPGPGGWAVLWLYQGQQFEKWGRTEETTSHVMEVTAALIALSTLPDGTKVTITTDSRVVQQAASGWLQAWKKNGWRKSNNKPVSSVELWKALDFHQNRMAQVVWNWTPGHAGNPLNERVDELAYSAAAGTIITC